PLALAGSVRGATAGAGLGAAAIGLGAAAIGLGAAAIGLGVAAIGLGAAAIGLGAAAIGLGGAGFGGTALAGSPSDARGAPGLTLAPPPSVLGNFSCGSGAATPTGGFCARSRAVSGSCSCGASACPRDSIRFPTITPSTNSMQATTALPK